jgi:predicted metal-dependent phosphotriesterase family hydrolase
MNQQKVLEDAGADLSKVYYSHVEAEFGWEGRTLSQQIDYLEEVVRKGSTLSYNNFGNWAHTRPEHLSAIIGALVDRGYSDHHVATMDLIFDYVAGQRKVLWEDINVDGKDRTYSYLLSHAVPWMISEGVSATDVGKMIQHTPARIFGS